MFAIVVLLRVIIVNEAKYVSVFGKYYLVGTAMYKNIYMCSKDVHWKKGDNNAPSKQRGS